MAGEALYYGTGRRKNAVARASIEQVKKQENTE